GHSADAGGRGVHAHRVDPEGVRNEERRRDRPHRGLFFFKQKTAYELGLGIPAEPLFRSFRVGIKSNISTIRNNLISGVDRCIHLNAMKKTTITSINRQTIKI